MAEIINIALTPEETRKLVRESNTKSVPVVEIEGERVITTEQLSRIYGCDVANIKKNFNANKEHFEEGKHYFKLTGDALTNLRVTNSDLQISPKTRSLYFWTRRGASRHCKMLGTDLAWDMFDALEEFYFDAPRQPVVAEMSNEEILGRAFEIQTERLNAANEKIAELSPKAEFYDAVTQSDALLSMGDVAKVLDQGVGRNKLFSILRDEGVLDSRNVPYQRYVSAGLFKPVENKCMSNGKTRVYVTTCVYQKGVDYIRRMLNRRQEEAVELVELENNNETR